MMSAPHSHTANHDEAYQLACLKQEESNLARCYLALRSETAPSEREKRMQQQLEVQHAEILRLADRLRGVKAPGFDSPMHINASTPNRSVEQWQAWAEYACRRFKEETGKDLQAQAGS